MIDYKIIIPARYNSRRFPGKPLVKIHGKTMLERVWLNASESAASEIIIATDDQRIETAAKNFGANVCVTSNKHKSGTDRIIEAIELLGLRDDEIILNVQGDEPLLSNKLMDECASLISGREDCIGTLASPFSIGERLDDPNLVKVLVNTQGYAIYFSRAPIPFNYQENKLEKNKAILLHHGIYTYNCNTLRKLTKLTISSVFDGENLEQLKPIYNGIKIRVGEASKRPGPSVDVFEDVKLVEEELIK
tara:strand:+ start:2842 stop:3585 length:744 start_codon:yes stop_codon:yes gene_type:complete